MQPTPGTNVVAVFEAQFGKALISNTIELQEDIAKGQYVGRFTVEGKVRDRWFQLATGTTIGRKRILPWLTNEDSSTGLATAMRRGIVHSC